MGSWERWEDEYERDSRDLAQQDATRLGGERWLTLCGVLAAGVLVWYAFEHTLVDHWLRLYSWLYFIYIPLCLILPLLAIFGIANGARLAFKPRGGMDLGWGGWFAHYTADDEDDLCGLGHSGDAGGVDLDGDGDA